MQFFTTNDDVKIAYSDQGTGLPILCLAGLTRNSKDFDFVAPHLAHIRLIRMDYRGRGASDWANSTTYNVAQEAGDTLALLDHLNLEKVAILGTSRGGLIAMALAAMAHTRLLGVCLNDIGPELDMAGMAVIMTYLGVKPTAKTLDEAAHARAGFMQGFEGVDPSRWCQEVTHMFTETSAGLDLTYDPALREAVIEAAGAGLPDLWPFFGAFKGLPTALIHAMNSNILTGETVAKMQAILPEMLVAKVPGRGHAPFLDEPEALTTINAWIEALE